MKIYTSYFGNLKKIEQASIFPIGIAIIPPRWFHGISYTTVAPRREMLHLDNVTYTYEFNKILFSRDPHQVYADLYRLSQGKDMALLCYEKPNEFCHRHIVAKWLSNSLGIEIQEFNHKPEVPQPKQGDLF